MSILASLKRLVAGAPPSPVDQLYTAIVVTARRPDWYVDGAVPDTLDGRFDMVALILSLLLLRLEEVTGGNVRHPAAQLSADLADRFIADMEGNLREDGISDQAVPRHLGQMMAALGGRLGAYRAARGDAAAMAEALHRNLYRGADVPVAATAHVVAETRRLSGQLAATSFARLSAGMMEPAT
jgi:cytochrome b pre-mRNA-processing protein 3